MNLTDFDFNKITGFEWDDGNIEKNKKKHNLDKWQIEEIFFNEPILVYDDIYQFLIGFRMERYSCIELSRNVEAGYAEQ